MLRYGCCSTGMGPLSEGQKDIFHNKTLTAIGKKHGKSAAQVILPEDGSTLYTFRDEHTENTQRNITAVYTNDVPQVREDQTSVSCRPFSKKICSGRNFKGLLWGRNGKAAEG